MASVSISVGLSADSDLDGITDNVENASACLYANDANTDDDGIPGEEDLNFNGGVDPGETDPRDADTVGDNTRDGAEKGVVQAVAEPDGQGALPGADEDMLEQFSVEEVIDDVKVTVMAIGWG